MKGSYKKKKEKTKRSGAVETKANTTNIYSFSFTFYCLNCVEITRRGKYTMKWKERKKETNKQTNTMKWKERKKERKKER